MNNIIRVVIVVLLAAAISAVIIYRLSLKSEPPIQAAVKESQAETTSVEPLPKLIVFIHFRPMGEFLIVTMMAIGMNLKIILLELNQEHGVPYDFCRFMLAIKALKLFTNLLKIVRGLTGTVNL